MMLKYAVPFALAASTAFAAGSVQAQDISAAPTYGTQNLSVGFLPDPVEVSLAAGGSTQATVSGQGSCAGFHAVAPDVDLVYEAGSMPLYIYVDSAADTTLLVNQPDGSWICNDDTIGLNPVVAIPTPQSGMYNIYVGTYNSGELPPATLKISEISPN